jgi:serine/threonine-protein kinase
VSRSDAATAVAQDIDKASAPAPAAPVQPSFIRGYEIQAVLGRGAMGIVYKARQPGLKRIVALKMILSGDFAGEGEMRRFRAEAEVIGRLHHPNIVQIYEIGEDEGRPFFSMEFVDGTSLAKKIAATPQPPRDAARITQLLATALHSAHLKSIVHRDVKPANVLLAPDGTPKLTDFGLAKTLEEQSGQTHSGAILGTPSYMAPEQAEGRINDIGPHSDIYSLGAVLYELLTGRAPFKAASVFDTLNQVRTMEPVAPVQFAPTIPRDLETICLKCLQKDPRRRYESASALADDLGRFLAGETILARPISQPERLWRWCRRNPRVAVLSGLVVLALCAWATTTSILALSLKREKDNTELARREAEQQANRAEENARLARENEDTAKKNAERAEKNAERAQKNAERAEKNAQLAQREHQQVVTRLLRLADQLQNRLSARRMGSNPEMRSVREDLLKLLRETVLALGKDLEKADVSSFAMAYTHQQLGDLFVRIGLGSEALQQFQKAHDLVKQVVDAQPNNDTARANLSVMLMRIGEASLELQGDARSALKSYQAAYDLLKEIAEHPRSGSYTVADLKRLMSGGDVHLGKAYLALGELPAASQRFEESATFRQEWRKLEPLSVPAESYLCESFMWLGITAGRVGNSKKASLQFDKSLEICESLVRRFPKDISFKADLATLFGHIGDSQLLSGLIDDAAKSYQKSKDHLLVVLNANTEDTSHQSLTALTHERLAALAIKQKNADEAKRRFQEALKIRDDMCQIEPNNQTWRAAYTLALARVGKTVEAIKFADELCARAPRSASLLLQAARCYAVCGQFETDDNKKRQLTEKVLNALRGVIEVGWKDARLIDTDPELAAVRNEAGYRDLMDRFQKPAP